MPGDELQDASGRQVLLVDPHAERRKRVLDRVHQCRRGDDHAALANAAEVDVVVERHGLKVLDLSSYIAGPAATTILADFGADVIKIEPPGTGDVYRFFSTMPPNISCCVRWVAATSSFTACCWSILPR